MSEKKLDVELKNWLLRDKYNGLLPERGVLEKDFKRIKSGEPLDYVIGWRDFLGCRIDLSERTLIPREETEFWVNELIAQKPSRPVLVIDMFSGSGCVGLAILKHWPEARVVFVDKDDRAIRQIKKNLKLNNISSRRWKVIKSNVWDGLSQKARYDYILANPPYIPSGRFERLPKSVRKFEPKTALISGRDGLRTIKKFLTGLPAHLNENGQVVMEFDVTQKFWLKKKLIKMGYRDVVFLKDQFGRFRNVSFGLGN